MKGLNEIQKALALHRLEVVAAETGLSYNTVRRYATGVVVSPPLESVQRLSDWLSNHEAVARAGE